MPPSVIGRACPSAMLLHLIAEGCSNRAISSRLQVSEATVKGYASSPLDKLGVASRLEALVRASDAGLI